MPPSLLLFTAATVSAAAAADDAYTDAAGRVLIKLFLCFVPDLFVRRSRIFCSSVFKQNESA